MFPNAQSIAEEQQNVPKLAGLIIFGFRFYHQIRGEQRVKMSKYIWNYFLSQFRYFATNTSVWPRIRIDFSRKIE